MTLVTAQVLLIGSASGRKFLLRAQSGKIFNQDLAAIDLDQAFRLQAGQVARDEFAYRANFKCNLLVPWGKENCAP